MVLPIDDKINNTSIKIMKLNDKDQVRIFNRLRKTAKDDRKKEIYKNLLSNLRLNQRLKILAENNLQNDDLDNDYLDEILNEENYQMNSIEEFLLNEKNNEPKIISQPLPLEGNFYKEEIEILTNKFIDNLFNENNKPQNLNTVGNLIKELSPNDQEKVMNILKNEAINKNYLPIYNKLEDKINILNNLREKIKINEINNNNLIDMEITELTLDNLTNMTISIINELFEEDKFKINQQPNNQNKSNDIYQENKYKNMSYILVKLNLDDQQKIFDLLNENTKNDKEKNYVNNLIDKVNETNKLKNIAKDIFEKQKQNYTEQIEKINKINLFNDEMNQYLTNFENTLFTLNDKKLNLNKIQQYINQKKEGKNLFKIKDTINNFSENDKKKLLEKLNEKADDNEKKIKLWKLIKLINNSDERNELNERVKSEINYNENDDNSFENKIKEKQIQKNVENQMKNEENYGIFIVESNDKKNNYIVAVINSRQKLEENKFNELINIFEKDLYQEPDTKLTEIEKYVKDKEMDKKLCNIANIICNLNENDKEKIIENLNEKADNKKKKYIYQKLVESIEKTNIKKENEKIIIHKKTLKEVEKINNEGKKLNIE